MGLLDRKTDLKTRDQFRQSHGHLLHKLGKVFAGFKSRSGLIEDMRKHTYVWCTECKTQHFLTFLRRKQAIMNKGQFGA